MIQIKNQPTMFVLYSILLLFCFNFIPSLSQCPSDYQLFVIRNIPSGLVISAQETDLGNITIQTYTGQLDQLWRFERASRPGLFYIISEQTGLAVDIGGCTLLDNGRNYCSIIARPPGNSFTQEWFIDQNTEIISGFNYLALNIDRIDYTPGNNLCLYPGDAVAGNYRWTLEKKN